MIKTLLWSLIKICNQRYVCELLFFSRLVVLYLLVCIFFRTSILGCICGNLHTSFEVHFMWLSEFGRLTILSLRVNYIITLLTMIMLQKTSEKRWNHGTTGFADSWAWWEKISMNYKKLPYQVWLKHFILLFFILVAFGHICTSSVLSYEWYWFSELVFLLPKNKSIRGRLPYVNELLCIVQNYNFCYRL